MINKKMSKMDQGYKITTEVKKISEEDYYIIIQDRDGNVIERKVDKENLRYIIQTIDNEIV